MRDPPAPLDAEEVDQDDERGGDDPHAIGLGMGDYVVEGVHVVAHDLLDLSGAAGGEPAQRQSGELVHEPTAQGGGEGGVVHVERHDECGGADGGQVVDDAQALSKGLPGHALERTRRHPQLAETAGPEGLIAEEGADDLRSPRMERGAHGSHSAVVDDGRGPRQEPIQRSLLDGEDVITPRRVQPRPSGQEDPPAPRTAQAVHHLSGEPRRVAVHHASEADDHGWRPGGQEALDVRRKSPGRTRPPEPEGALGGAPLGRRRQQTGAPGAENPPRGDDPGEGDRARRETETRRPPLSHHPSPWRLGRPDQRPGGAAQGPRRPGRGERNLEVARRRPGGDELSGQPGGSESLRDARSAQGLLGEDDDVGPTGLLVRELSEIVQPPPHQRPYATQRERGPDRPRPHEVVLEIEDAVVQADELDAEARGQVAEAPRRGDDGAGPGLGEGAGQRQERLNVTATPSGDEQRSAADDRRGRVGRTHWPALSHR